ncbi:hypothetical protein [Dietzia cercidiphylli]|uniref:hypothetical protein n=1 Tax=Dietzia cercidiphylli TaxID=498199 RepID=UPI00223C108B|nr:hypothetical protein [Dietzia cercidiphylli]MCT1515301.1 hypothetical protein [Dietzia cercidiphylli]
MAGSTNKPKNDYSQAPRISDEVFFGGRLTLAELNVRPEGTYDDDPRIDRDILAQARDLDDVDDRQAGPQ